MLQLNPFERSGLAALSDLQTPELKELFQLLEKEQEFFLSKEKLFRSPEYKWPRDPLHTWSRIWEYPYVYYHLKKWREQYKGNELPIVVDFGSGVTFFPFAVARLGYHVICVDNDPICEKDMQKAISVVPHSLGKVEFCLNKGQDIPLPNKYADIIYSISVLEHIPDFTDIISEMARVLKNNGLLILTVDLGLNSNFEMNVTSYKELLAIIDPKFKCNYPVVSNHPMDIITTWNSLYPYRKPTKVFLFLSILRQFVRIFTNKEKNYLFLLPLNIAVHGFILQKR